MNEDVIGFAVFALAFLVPPLLGFALGRFKPNLTWPRVGLIGGIPGSLPALGLAIYLHVTEGVSQPANCNPPDCNGAALWIYALYAIALFTFAIGFMLACAGRALGFRRDHPDQ